MSIQQRFKALFAIVLSLSYVPFHASAANKCQSLFIQDHFERPTETEFDFSKKSIRGDVIIDFDKLTNSLNEIVRNYASEDHLGFDRPEVTSLFIKYNIALEDYRTAGQIVLSFKKFYLINKNGKDSLEPELLINFLLILKQKKLLDKFKNLTSREALHFLKTYEIEISQAQISADAVFYMFVTSIIQFKVHNKNYDLDSLSPKEKRDFFSHLLNMIPSKKKTYLINVEEVTPASEF